MCGSGGSEVTGTEYGTVKAQVERGQESEIQTFKQVLEEEKCSAIKGEIWLNSEEINCGRTVSYKEKCTCIKNMVAM